jgi:hypothetical protein
MNPRFLVVTCSVLALVLPTRADCLLSGETASAFLEPYQTNTYCFTAISGDYATIALGSEYPEWVSLRLISPAGEILAAHTAVFSVVVDHLRLTNSGEFTIVVSSYDWGLACNVTPILNTAENEGPIQSGETKGKLLLYGDLDAYYFVADANQTASISLARQSGGASSFSLYGPDGSLVTNAFGNFTAGVSGVRLTQPGRYTILCRNLSFPPSPLEYNLTFVAHPGENDGLLPFGQTRSAIIDFGDMDAYYFEAAADQKITLLAVKDLFVGIGFALELHDPSGAILVNQTISSVANIVDYPLPRSGRYMLLCRNLDGYPFPPAPLLYSLTLLTCPGANQPSPDGGLITPGSVHSASMEFGDIDTFDFSAAKGDSFTLNIAVPDWPIIRARLYEGCTLIASNQGNKVQFALSCLPRASQYTLVCQDVHGVYAFDYTVSLQQNSIVPVPPNDPDPHLVIVRCDTSILLRWLTNTPGVKLQTSDTLGPADWVDLSTPPQTDGDTYWLSVAPTEPKRFYRLTAP